MRWPRFLPIAIAILGCNDILGVEVRTLPVDGGAGGGGNGDGGGGADGGGGDAPACPLLSCGASCVEPSVSNEHCGRCDHACGAGEACFAGVCDRRLRRSGSKGQCVRGPGGLACWGTSAHGQSGTGEPSTPNDIDPRLVVVLAEQDVPLFASSTSTSTCVLIEGGAIRCFGSNRDGELGVGTTGGPEDGGSDPDCCYVTEAVAPLLPDVERFVDIAGAGDSQPGFFVALSDDGDVYCWGSGSATPIQIMSDAVQIVAGGSFACALDHLGDVWCWGSPWSVGPDNAVCGQAVTKVDGLRAIRAIGAGDTAGFAIGQDGTVFAWGDNRWGALGPGFTVGFDYYPARPLEHVFAAPVAEITGMNAATCALLTNGEVYCWGENGHQGDGTPFLTQTVDPEPRRANIAGVTQLAASYTDFSAIDDRGRLFRWTGFWNLDVPTELELP